MKKFGFNISFLALLVSCLISSCETDQKTRTDNSEKTGDAEAKVAMGTFEKVDSNQSGIDFNNTITHDVSTRFNLFDYDYFYNGSGVGIEDLNNDGLMDIVFTGNQVENKLFINKGDLNFEDRTQGSNLNQSKFWASGITFADVNQDGWMDIYISQGGPYSPEQRRNLLFINQKDLTFKESAKEYGLDDPGISTQSAFFDFDKDGDLDCVVMNENDYYGTDPDRFYQILSNKKLLMQNCSHLYENINGRFVNITEKAGLLKPTFGLGLSVSDLNDDGWLDIYIANDYYVPDAMYINKGDGTFSDKIKETTNQVSFYGMGLDVADINNDNLQDIIVLDMASSDHIRSKTLMASMNVPRFNLLIEDLGLQHQYMFNSLQLNMGNNTYTNISHLSGMSKTDWSWAALVFDANHDALEDVYVTNGYRRYALDNDARMMVARARQEYRGNVPLDVKNRIYDALPSERLANILYQNQGSLKFEDVTSYSALNEPSFSNGAAYSDLDNDGDLDLVVNNIDQQAFLFKNLATENQMGNSLTVELKGGISEDFAKVEIEFNGIKKTKESKRVRGYLSAVDKRLHFGLGNSDTVDRLLVRWASGKVQQMENIAANQSIVLDESNAVDATDTETKQENPFFRSISGFEVIHEENRFNDFQKEVLLPYKQSTLGPSVVSADLNGDNKKDLLIGGASGQPLQLFLQENNELKPKQVAVFEKDKESEDMEILVYDHDNDGDQDIYVVSGGSEFNERATVLRDRLYLNDGNASFTRYENAELDVYTISGMSVSAIDFDKDGDTDLIVGNRIVPQKYPIHEPSIIYQNNDGVLTNVTAAVAPDFEDFGLVNDLVVTDINKDGWDDFIAVGEWTPIGLFINDQGTFSYQSSKSGLDKKLGWWFNVTETDINNDGYPDFLVGNVGKNIKFKVSVEKPLRVYADDFDDNGTHDVVLSYKYNDVFVPVRGKECSTQQMPFISEKMPTYAEFANATLEDIYGSKINTAYQREANLFETILLINDGNGNLSMVKLPSLVQTMPVMDAVSVDVNSDGFLDLVLVGNIFNTEVETPRLDNPYGLVLISDGNKSYSVVPPLESGLYINGDAKSVDILELEDKTMLVVGCNNGPAEFFELYKPTK